MVAAEELAIIASLAAAMKVSEPWTVDGEDEAWIKCKTRPARSLGEVGKALANLSAAGCEAAGRRSTRLMLLISA